MDNNRLDETVKKTLRNYEVPYNANDWVQMESMLNVAPKHNPLGRSYSPAILFALVIMGAAFLLYAVFKPSGKTSAIRTDTVVSPPKVNTKTPELKPVATQSVISDPVLPPVKKEVKSPVKAVATRSVTVTPADQPIKKDVKKTEKKITEQKTIEKKTTADKTSTPEVDSSIKSSKQKTLSSQENKALLFKKTLEKNKKTAKKEMKPEVKQEETDTVHIDDENDSNRNRKVLNINTSAGTPDSLKKSEEQKTRTKRSKKVKKTNGNDSLNKKARTTETLDPETIKKTTEQNQKDTLKTGN